MQYNYLIIIRVIPHASRDRDIKNHRTLYYYTGWSVKHARPIFRPTEPNLTLRKSTTEYHYSTTLNFIYVPISLKLSVKKKKTFYIKTFKKIVCFRILNQT